MFKSCFSVSGRWVLTAALASVAVWSGAKSAHEKLVPAASAYVASVPDAPAFYTAWKENAIAVAINKALESPEAAQAMGDFSKELKTIEASLGFKLDAATLSSVFSSIDFYMMAGEREGAPKIAVIGDVADADKLTKLLDLAEKSASAAAAKADDDEDEGNKKASDKKSSEKEEKSEENKKESIKSKPADDKGDGSTGGAEKTAKKDADADKKSGDEAEAKVVTSEEYKGHTIKTLKDGDEASISYAVADKLFVASNNLDEVKALLDRSKAPDAATEVLAANANYKKVSAALEGHAGQAYVYTNTKAAMELQKQGGENKEVAKLQELAQRLNSVEFGGASMTIEPKAIKNYGYQILADKNSAMSKYPGGKPLEIVKLAPENALMNLSIGFLDLATVYSFVKEAGEAVGGEGANMEKQLATAEQTLGFSVKNDLIPALGNEMAVLLNGFKMDTGTPEVAAGMAFSVADQTKLKKVLNSLELLAGMASAGASADSKKKSGDDKASDGGLKTETVGTATIKYVELPGQAAYTPGYALDGNYVVFGSSKQALKQMVEAKTGKGLGDSAAVKALDGVTTDGNAFFFLDFTQMFEAAKPLLGMVPPDGPGAQALNVARTLKSLGGMSKVEGDAVIQQSVLTLN